MEITTGFIPEVKEKKPAEPKVEKPREKPAEKKPKEKD